MKSIYDLTLDNMEKEFLELGEKKFRTSQVFEWLYRKHVTSFDDMTNLSQGLRELLKQTYTLSPLEISQKQRSQDGTVKYLFKVEDGYIETVLMTHPYGKSLCVTSQLGCNMGCQFCASGLLKKKRNLTTDRKSVV